MNKKIILLEKFVRLVIHYSVGLFSIYNFIEIEISFEIICYYICTKYIPTE